MTIPVLIIILIILLLTYFFYDREWDEKVDSEDIDEDFD